jgi:hypothetical protein
MLNALPYFHQNEEFKIHLNTLLDIITSRKHGHKEPQSFSHCGSFDHPDLQSLNNC